MRQVQPSQPAAHATVRCPQDTHPPRTPGCPAAPSPAPAAPQPARAQPQPRPPRVLRMLLAHAAASLAPALRATAPPCGGRRRRRAAWSLWSPWPCCLTRSVRPGGLGGVGVRSARRFIFTTEFGAGTMRHACKSTACPLSVSRCITCRALLLFGITRGRRPASAARRPPRPPRRRARRLQRLQTWPLAAAGAARTRRACGAPPCHPR
jgi:hypothetical protein